METKDLNSIGLAYLEMVEKKNIEAKKNHADALHKNQKALDVHSDEDEDHNDDPTDGDGDIDAADLKKLRKDADKDDKKFDKKKKSSKKDDDDDEQEKFKAYTGDDKDGQQGAAIGEDKEDKFEPHMMYDPKTGKGYKAEKEEDHLRMKKMGYTHDKPEEIDEASKEGTIRIIDLSRVHPDNKMGAKETSGHQVQRMTKGKFVNQGKPYAKKAQAEKERNSGQSSMQFEAKNITTDNNALVSFYQIHSTSPKPRLAGHMNMEVLGGQHQMSAADIKNISNRAVKAGVGKMVKVDNSMLPKHIADYKKENKPAPPKIAVALSQHHAKSLDESTDLQEGAARQAAFHKSLMDYCKDIGKDHMDHKDFADHAKHVKAGNWDKARTHADDQDTEVREKIHSLAIDHLGQGAASELYGGDRVSLSKNKGDGKLHASYNESVNVDDVLALIDQGYTLDQAEAMVAEACGTVNASRKQSKAGEIDKNIANDQRSLPVSGKDDIPVRPGTKQQQRDFDKGAKMAKSKDKVSVSKAPWDTKEGFTSDAQRKAVWASKNDAKNEELSVGQKKIAKQTPPRNKITGDDFKHLRKHGHGNSPQKESVMNRVSNMVEGIRADIQEKNEINEVSKGTLRDYAKKAVRNIEKQKADADKFEFRGMASQSRTVQHKNFAKATDADRKADNRKKGIDIAVDKLARESVGKKLTSVIDRKSLQKYRFAKEYEKRGMKYPYSTADTSKADEKEARAMIAQISNREKKESVQEAAKPTGIHHPIDPMPGKEVNSKDAAGRAADIRARRNPLSMTEKEFVEMHQVPTTVAPEFDGNIAAKQTAENAKKAPIKQAKTPNIPTAKGDQTVVKSTQAPAANAGVVGESYMDKYAKYIRGDK